MVVPHAIEVSLVTLIVGHAATDRCHDTDRAVMRKGGLANSRRGQTDQPASCEPTFTPYSLHSREKLCGKMPLRCAASFTLPPASSSCVLR